MDVELKSCLFSVNLKPYPYTLLVAIFTPVEELKSLLEENGYNKEQIEYHLGNIERSAGRVSSFNDGRMILWIPETINLITFISRLTHEINHVIDFVFEDLPIPLNESTYEPYAYSKQQLMKDILEEVLVIKDDAATIKNQQPIAQA